MRKKIVFKTASMIRSPQSISVSPEVKKRIPDEVEKKLEAWINLPEKPKMIRLNINISVEMHKQIKKFCADKGISITDFVIQLLHQEMSK